MAYYKETSPLIGYYYAKGLLCSVDGLAEIKQVKGSILSVLS
jgi:adenylate kinase